MPASPNGSRPAAWDPVDRVIAFVASRALLLGASLALVYLSVAVTGEDSLTDPLIPGFGMGIALIYPLALILTAAVWLCASGALLLARGSVVAAGIGVTVCVLAEFVIVAAGILSMMNVRPVTVVGAVLLAGGSAALLAWSHRVTRAAAPASAA
jgi:hypothetical protein